MVQVTTWTDPENFIRGGGESRKFHQGRGGVQKISSGEGGESRKFHQGRGGVQKISSEEGGPDNPFFNHQHISKRHLPCEAIDTLEMKNKFNMIYLNNMTQGTAIFFNFVSSPPRLGTACIVIIKHIILIVNFHYGKSFKCTHNWPHKGVLSPILGTFFLVKSVII